MATALPLLWAVLGCCATLAKGLEYWPSWATYPTVDFNYTVSDSSPMHTYDYNDGRGWIWRYYPHNDHLWNAPLRAGTGMQLDPYSSHMAWCNGSQVTIEYMGKGMSFYGSYNGTGKLRLDLTNPTSRLYSVTFDGPLDGMLAGLHTRVEYAPYTATLTLLNDIPYNTTRTPDMELLNFTHSIITTQRESGSGYQMVNVTAVDESRNVSSEVHIPNTDGMVIQRTAEGEANNVQAPDADGDFSILFPSPPNASMVFLYGIVMPIFHNFTMRTDPAAPQYNSDIIVPASVDEQKSVNKLLVAVVLDARETYNISLVRNASPFAFSRASFIVSDNTTVVNNTDDTAASTSPSPVPNSAPPDAPSVAPSGAPSNENENTQRKSNKTGAIAGGVVGGVCGVALLLALAWCLRRRRREGSTAPFAALPVRRMSQVDITGNDHQSNNDRGMSKVYPTEYSSRSGSVPQIPASDFLSSAEFLAPGHPLATDIHTETNSDSAFGSSLDTAAPPTEVGAIGTAGATKQAREGASQPSRQTQPTRRHRPPARPEVEVSEEQDAGRIVEYLPPRYNPAWKDDEDLNPRHAPDAGDSGEPSSAGDVRAHSPSGAQWSTEQGTRERRQGEA